jgi:hypothetical protein
MGLLGSLLAWRLTADGITFTWHDTDTPHTAWKASTGLVYPAGDARSQRNLAAWTDWWARPTLPPGVLLPVHYVFAHRHPPHEGRYRTTPLGPGLTLAHAAAFTVDVPQLVHTTRGHFASRRTDTPPPDADVLVRAHGHHRAVCWMWGWSAPVQLRLPAVLAELPHRPALYGRKVRQLVYAYPIPSRPGWWWAGSTLTRQTHPRSLSADAHLRRWMDNWAAVWPRIDLTAAEAPAQGWRPRPDDADTPDPVRVDTARGPVITLPALWHSGVRWAPEVIDHTVDQLARIGGVA